MVGNGNEIDSLQVCRDVLIQVQEHKLTVDFHVLPLCGADLVLGVQWLKLLGPILTDYTDLTMKFMHQGRVIKLRGKHDDNIRGINHNQLRCMVQTDGVSAFFHI